MSHTMRTPLAAFVFDAYGTLFDVHSVGALAERLAPGRGAELARLWRAKQLEYSWLQSLMAGSAQRRDHFDQVTAHALDFAAEMLALPLGPDAKTQLRDAYRELAAFTDARAALAALAPLPRWILSNGTLAGLASTWSSVVKMSCPCTSGVALTTSSARPNGSRTIVCFPGRPPSSLS